MKMVYDLNEVVDYDLNEKFVDFKDWKKEYRRLMDWYKFSIKYEMRNCKMKMIKKKGKEVLIMWFGDVKENGVYGEDNFLNVYRLVRKDK